MLERIGIVATAFVAFLALFPYYGLDTLPPQHFSVFNKPRPRRTRWRTVARGGVGLLTLVVLELVRRSVHRNRKTWRRAAECIPCPPR